MTYLIGIDVGTQSVRSCLFDLEGSVGASATRPLVTSFPKPAWAEQDRELHEHQHTPLERQLLSVLHVVVKNAMYVRTGETSALSK